MPTSLPYLPSNKNIETLFSKIQSAKVPEKFTHEFLTTTLGLKSTADRALIPLLRTLGFIDQSSTPTNTYRLLKSADTMKGAIAASIKKAYAPLFEANENAYTLQGEKLKGLVAQVAGTDDGMTDRIVWTLNSLLKVADFSQPSSGNSSKEEADASDAEEAAAEQKTEVRAKGLRPEFHYNIQIHLPANASEEVYLNIFNALRKSFQ